MKQENNNGKCKCGGKLVPEDDRLICSVCGTPVFSKALRHKYLERNKADILKDLNTLTRAQVLKKWGIPPPTLSGLLRRWKYHPAAPPCRSEAVLEPRAMGGCQPSRSFPTGGNQRSSWRGLKPMPA